MDDPIDRLMVDPSLMPILTARVGATASANLLDDLAHGIAGADLRLMAVIGMTTNLGHVSFESRTDALNQVLSYRATLGPGVSWDGVHAIVQGTFPETMTLALVGEPIKTLVDHPQLDPALVIDYVFEEPDETYFGTTAESRTPITIREAIGDQAGRLTTCARRFRTLRRRIMLGKHWRTRLNTIMTLSLVAYIALTATLASGILYRSDAITSTSLFMTVILMMGFGPFIILGYLGSARHERALNGHYNRIAFATRVRLENGHDTTKHFASMTRTLTG